MAEMIAVTTRMNRIAMKGSVSLGSSSVGMASVYQSPGLVMRILTVMTIQMKPHSTWHVRPAPVIPTHSLPVVMAGVYPSCGSVTLTMIVEITVMRNQWENVVSVFSNLIRLSVMFYLKVTRLGHM